MLLNNFSAFVLENTERDSKMPIPELAAPWLIPQVALGPARPVCGKQGPSPPRAKGVVSLVGVTVMAAPFLRNTCCHESVDAFHLVDEPDIGFNVSPAALNVVLLIALR